MIEIKSSIYSLHTIKKSKNDNVNQSDIYFRKIVGAELLSIEISRFSADYKELRQILSMFAYASRQSRPNQVWMLCARFALSYGEK